MTDVEKLKRNAERRVFQQWLERTKSGHSFSFKQTSSGRSSRSVRAGKIRAMRNANSRLDAAMTRANLKASSARAVQTTTNPATSASPSAVVIRLQWTVLPEGWWQKPVRGSGRGAGGVQQHSDELHRIKFIDGLGPKAWYEGRDVGIRRYYVAVFKRVVVADCPDSGNALYYYGGKHDWKDIFRKSKRDALRAGAQRIYHAGDWKERLRRML